MSSTAKALSPAEAKRRREMIDELGAINVERAEAIKKEMREVWMEGEEAAVQRSFTGARYIAVVSARRMHREVNVKRVYKFKGIRWLLEWCELSVKTVEDHVSLPDRRGMISQDQTGSRSVSVSPLPRAVELRKAA